MDLQGYDSREELIFSWWLEPLIREEIVLYAEYQPKPFELSCSKHTDWIEPLKRSIKEHSRTLLNSHKYTADWKLIWNPKYLNVIFTSWDQILTGKPHSYFNIICNHKNGKYFSVIDIKGGYVAQNNSSGITFPLNQKWVMANHNIYVQKIVPEPSLTKAGKLTPANALFLNTFIPERPEYLLTEKTKKPRKINFKTRTFNEYFKLIVDGMDMETISNRM